MSWNLMKELRQLSPPLLKLNTSFHSLSVQTQLQLQQKIKFPWDLLNEAYIQIQNRHQEETLGSSTACVVSLLQLSEGKYPILAAANLGDSGFMVIRNGKIIFRSEEQQQAGHFNAPFQLSVVSMKYRGNVYFNEPSEAARIQMSINRGDLIVLATDGLFDNLFDDQILEILEVEKFKFKKSNEEVQLGLKRAARSLVNEARVKARDLTFYSPFTQRAELFGLDAGLGGKWDDVSVVVALVDRSF